MEKVGSPGNDQHPTLPECSSSVPEFMSSQEEEVRESLYAKLQHVPTLKDADLDITCKLALQLACFNASNARRVYWMLQYLLERNPVPRQRKAIVSLLDRLVVAEHTEASTPRKRRGAPRYTPVINEHLSNISYAADEHCQGGVREFLHQCIASWTKMGVSHRNALAALQKAEAEFHYRQPRPKLELADNSPSEFDLVSQGLAGLGFQNNLQMWELVQQGILEGQREGWIDRTESGALHVKCQ